VLDAEVPAAQSEQDVEAGGANVPKGQLRHVLETAPPGAVEEVPDGQLVHPPLFSLTTEPAEHRVQLEEPAREKKPEAQLVQLELPGNA